MQKKMALALALAGALLLILALFLTRKPNEQILAPVAPGPKSPPKSLKALVVQSSDNLREGPVDESLPETAPKASTARPQPTRADQAENQIAERLQLQSRYFFRCYSHLLEKDPTLKGQVIIGFAIGPNGEVNLAQITKSDFKDDAFHRCILDVVNRTPFPSFEGKTISTLFPLQFE